MESIKVVDLTSDQIVKVGDLINNAVRVNVVATVGGGGGGATQVQVRSAGGVSTDVGFAAGNLNVPVQLITALPTGANVIGAVNQGTNPWITDVTDRTTRLLGIAKIVDTAGVNQLVITAANAAKVDGSAVTQPVSIAAAVDISDRIARLVGQITGQQADNSANVTTKLPTLPARANAAAPTWTEGNQVPLSVDLAGNQRVRGSDTIGVTATLNALNAAATVVLNGQNSVSFSLDAGTLTATLTTEVSYDGGVTFGPGSFLIDPATLISAGSISVTNPNALTQQLMFIPGGATNARVRVTVFTSGSATCTLRAVSQAQSTSGTFQVGGSGLIVAPWAMSSVQSATLLNQRQVSGAGATNVITLTGAANSRVTLKKLAVFSSVAALTAVTLTITDGATVVFDYGSININSTTTFIDAPIISGSTANNLIVTVGAIAAQTTTLSVIADRI